jgi:parvulin-like peptidyl-prolyl isomerase
MSMKKILLAAALAFTFASADDSASVSPAAPAASASPAPAKAAAKSTGTGASASAGVVITVGANKIQKKQIDKMLDQLSKAKEAMGGLKPGEKDAMKKMIATNLIGQELLDLEAKRLNVKAEDKDVDSLYKLLRANFPDEAKFQAALKEGGSTEKTFREKIVRQVKADKLLSSQMPKPQRPTVKEMLDYYAAHKEIFPVNDSLRACQVLFMSGSDAKGEEAAKRKSDLERLRAELAKDSADPEVLLSRFVMAARQFSDGPERKDGGDLQRFSPNDFNPEFKKQVSSLRVGQMSPVFRTPLGYHLVMLTEKFDGKPDSYRLAIGQLLQAEKSAAAGQGLKKYLQSLAAKYKVTYLEKDYRDTSPAGVYN